MPYPFVLAPNGNEIMRVNHDASLSVLWDQVLDERYKPLTDLNYPMVKCCQVLLAAQDNFVAVPWSISTSWADQWKDHLSTEVGYLDRPLVKGTARFTVAAFTTWEPVIIAQVTYEGQWSVNWLEVQELARLTPHPEIVALIGFCRLLVAAKDRFITIPLLAPIEEDEED